MQKIKIITNIVLILLLFIFLTGCGNNENMLKEKTENEIEYLSSKLLSVINRLNNITFENYRIIAEKAQLTKSSEEEEKTSSSEASQTTSKSSSEQEQSNTTKEGTIIIASQMSPNTILNSMSEPVDWEGLNNEMENVYYSWNTIILDLHNMNVSRDIILGFSKDLDIATQRIQEQDKPAALQSIAKLYSYLPSYYEQFIQDATKINLLKTKSHILNAYSLVETSDWNSIGTEIEYAENTFKPVTTDANIVSTHSYQVNKCYVLLNELKNSVPTNNDAIFYIKYRNLMEEINNL